MGGLALKDNVAALQVPEVTQALEEVLSQMTSSGQVDRQVPYSSDLGRLLGALVRGDQGERSTSIRMRT